MKNRINWFDMPISTFTSQNFFFNKKSFSRLSLFAFVSIMLSCGQLPQKEKSNTKAYSEINKLEWLLGKWYKESDKGSLTEIWHRSSDSTFVGQSFFIVGKDTVSYESIRLEQKGEQLIYSPAVRNQNAGEAITFVMSSASETVFVFENPSHDFPQKIQYSRVALDSLVAEISGNVDGRLVAQQFPLKRVSK